jgi:ubiquinone/menaquinone biosynthesis C-methylase UbiE/aryl carrier-like protein
MRSWTANTVARILALRPRRVLEIGCGTGLLLFRIAPYCETYVGTDFSAVALRHVAEGLAAQPWPQVRLLERRADDFRDLAEECFDVIVLNSVVQYFPSMDYLLQVLTGARRLLVRGGALFVGDVRSLPLLPVYHTALELQRAPAALSAAQLCQRVLRNLAQEQELLLDPTFFHALSRQLPGMSRVTIDLKAGRDRNELTQFRYDVVLKTADGIEEAANAASQTARAGQAGRWSADGDSLGWEETGLTVAGLDRLLRENAPRQLCVQRVPNARVSRAAAAWAWLSTARGPATAGEMRAALAALPEGGVEPDDLQQLVQDLGYRVAITWSDSGPDGRYDAIIARQPPGAEEHPTGARMATHGEAWATYANNPAHGAYARRLLPGLRRYLKERLPEYMVPATFVLLDALPLLPNGKLDRAALPAPDAIRPENARRFVLPRTPAEAILARIWADLLGMEQVGIHDNFFELGGDSILSIQIIARANQAGLRLTPRQLFQHQTIAELAAVKDEGHDLAHH